MEREEREERRERGERGERVELFRKSASIGAYLGEAHRRAILRRKAPAITRHLAFWPARERDFQREADQDGFDAKRNAFIALVNTVALAFQSRDFGWPGASGPRDYLDQFATRGGPKTETAPVRVSIPYSDPDTGALAHDEVSLPVKRHRDIIGFGVVWRGLRGTVELELHAEHAALSVALEIPEAGLATGLDGDAAAAAEAYRRVATNGAAAADGELLYDALWEDMETALARLCGGAAFEIETFCDLRGVAMVAPPPASAPTRAPREDDAALDPRAFTQAEAQALLADRKAFLKQILSEDARREYVGNRFLGGAAIFVSTLGSLSRRRAGARFDLSTDQFSSREARFVLIFKEPPDEAQFGRLLERFHAVETLRLAAIRDIAAIRDYGRTLRFEGRKLTDLEDVKISEKSPAARDRMLKDLEAISDTLATATRETQAGGEKIDAVTGGVSYRLNRSGHYAGIFRSRLEEFRILPIETWQPYDEFMRRRVFQALDYIQRLERRRAALRQRVDTQYAALQAYTLAENTDQLIQLNDINNRLSFQAIQMNQRLIQAVKATDLLTYVMAVLGAVTLSANLVEAEPARYVACGAAFLAATAFCVAHAARRRRANAAVQEDLERERAMVEHARAEAARRRGADGGR